MIQDPKNKQFMLCDDQLMTVFGGYIYTAVFSQNLIYVINSVQRCKASRL